MYLSRLILNPRSRQVQSELADPYQMHRTIMSAFPEDLPRDERVLFRLDQDPRYGSLNLIIQSQHLPDWRRLSDARNNYLLSGDELLGGVTNLAVKQVDLELDVGQILAFRLLANPTVKKKVDDKKNGRRVGLYREDEQLAWLQRKLESAGCQLINAHASNQERVDGKFHRGVKKAKMQFLSVRFDGFLRVQKSDQLLEAINNGIGSGKGLGFGLLSLGPAR